MMQRLASLALAGVISFGLAACQKDDEASKAAATAPVGPAETIERSAAQLQQGDVLGLVQSALPPEHYERVKSEWKERMHSDPPTDEERARFAETMQKLTAADAETALYAELEPQLAQMESEMAAQMPLMVGMGRGFAMQSIQQSEQLTAEQKQHAGQLVDAVGNWLQTANFFDRELAKRAIAEVVSTARELDVQTLDQIEAMEFEQAMQKAGIAMRGLFDVMQIYGLTIDDTLKSVDAELLSEQDGNAQVKVAYTVLAQPLTLNTEMVRIDDRWYGKDAIAELERARHNADDAGDDVDADEADATDEDEEAVDVED